MTIKRADTLFTLIVLLLGYSLFIYPQVISDWRTYSFDDGTYSHAYLMPFIIVTLLWQQRNNLVLRFQTGYLLAMLSVMAILAISIAAQQVSIIRLLFPLYVILLFCTLVKPSLALVVPLALLWFISPVWGSLTGPLQYISVVITKFIMQLTHIPVYVDGNFVQIPQGVFEIAEGCSGLRYFIVSLALSTLLCHLHLRKLKNMILLTLCAVVGAILVNGIRIVLIILIGYYSDMQSAIVKDHNMFGWFLYIPFIIVLFYLVGKLEPHAPKEEKQYLPQNIATLPLVLVIVTSLLMSGLSVRLLMGQYPLLDFSAVELTTTEKAQTPSPYIPAYSRKAHNVLDAAGVEVIDISYQFDGRHDANRADYYLNNIIPDGWAKVESELTDNSRLIWLSDHSGNSAILQYWYEANGQKSGSVGVYKRNRIKQALQLDAKSSLRWQFVRCSSLRCQDEAQLLRQLLNE
ncbi:MAG TPA: exosortase [Rheinheimera sp.]|uniref:exosortase n=1 Tax=Rheinheimera sp. TaxID=1869214 RepID=UPI002F94ED43